MKQIIFLMTAVFLLQVHCFAQNESKFKSLKDNIAKNDVATQHPKKGIDPKTWMDRGKLFQDAYNANLDLVRFGMSTIETKLYFTGKDPKILSSEEGGVKKETWEYSQIKLNFENEGLKTWEEIQTVVDDPLIKAVDAYKKAASLDEKGKYGKKIGEAYKLISGDLENKFFNEFNLLNYKKAYSTAMQRIEVNQLRGISDTTFYYYAGYIAMTQSAIDSSMWQSAVDNFEKAISLDYKEADDSKGDIYYRLYTSYMKTGNTEKAVQTAQTGFEKCPENDQLLVSLINYYMTTDFQLCLDYLEQAVAKDPHNANILFARGRILEEFGETEKSMANYHAAIAEDPNYFDPYYNIAVGYFNAAGKFLEELDKDIKLTNAQFEAKRDAIYEEYFMKAVPYMEKACQISPDNVEALDVLKSLYYRLKTLHPEMEAKYDEIVKKLEK